MLTLFVFLAFLGVALATLGVDVSQGYNKDSWSCLYKNGVRFAIPRVYKSTGAVDPNGASNVNNAHAAGIKYVDGYIFPCYSCGNPEAQMDATISNLANHGIMLHSNTTILQKNVGASVGMLWIDVEGTSYWSSNTSNNVNFIDRMIKEGQKKGATIGIYTSKSQWTPITGNTSKFSKFDLWYAHYDNSASFSDFSAFGGWNKPAIKQYVGDTSLCGVSIDKNFY